MLHKLCLQLISNDYTKDCESSQTKNKTATMKIKRLRVIATEIFKTINNRNPSYIKAIFIPNSCTIDFLK